MAVWYGTIMDCIRKNPEGHIGHDEAAWAEGQLSAALWFQNEMSNAMLAAMTLPISLHERLICEISKAFDNAADAENKFNESYVLAGIKFQLTRTYSYWVGYHNQLQIFERDTAQWATSGQISKDAFVSAAAAVHQAAKKASACVAKTI